jgi:carboxymethylenebutenolidase
MKKTVLLATLSVLACGPADDTSAEGAASMQDGASSAVEGWVEIAYGDRTVQAWVAQPEGSGPFPAIIVIHQNRGIDDWVRSVADRVAEEGYIALAPDLLSAMAPGGGNTADFADPDAAREGIGALDQAQVTADLNAAADYLAGLPNSTGEISVSGFCWGGSQTFAFATQRPDLEAAYVFYGTGPSDPAAYASLGARVYGFYGGEDNRVNATIEGSGRAVEAAGAFYEPVVYEGAGHGFMSRGETSDEGDPNRVAMDAGWERWRSLLEEAASGG